MLPWPSSWTWLFEADEGLPQNPHKVSGCLWFVQALQVSRNQAETNATTTRGSCAIHSAGGVVPPKTAWSAGKSWCWKNSSRLPPTVPWPVMVTPALAMVFWWVPRPPRPHSRPAASVLPRPAKTIHQKFVDTKYHGSNPRTQDAIVTARMTWNTLRFGNPGLFHLFRRLKQPNFLGRLVIHLHPVPAGHLSTKWSVINELPGP